MTPDQKKEPMNHIPPCQHPGTCAEWEASGRTLKYSFCSAHQEFDRDCGVCNRLEKVKTVEENIKDIYRHIKGYDKDAPCDGNTYDSEVEPLRSILEQKEVRILEILSNVDILKHEVEKRDVVIEQKDREIANLETIKVSYEATQFELEKKIASLEAQCDFHIDCGGRLEAHSLMLIEALKSCKAMSEERSCGELAIIDTTIREALNSPQTQALVRRQEKMERVVEAAKNLIPNEINIMHWEQLEMGLLNNLVKALKDLETTDDGK